MQLAGELYCHQDEEIGAAMKEAIAGKPQRHGFLEQIADAESRRMNEIGG